MRTGAFLALVLAAGLGLAVGLAAGARSDLGPAFGVARTATLSGSTEVPAGDSDGTGKALIRLNVKEGLVCWSVAIRGVDPMVAAHIHHGAAGVAGPVVVPLGTPQQVGSSAFATKGCATAPRALIRDIIANPADYYYNTHNKQFPGGVVRGQLAR